MRKFHLWIICTIDDTTRRFARGDFTLVAGAQRTALGTSAKWATGVCRSAMFFAAGCAAAAVLYARVGVWYFVVPPVLGGVAVFARVTNAPNELQLDMGW